MIKTYIVDIDGTICSQMCSETYHLAEPFLDRIKKINNLFNQGHTVIYWTARGQNSGIDFTELTAKQLKEWGCLFTELRMNKPSYDIWIDDKAKWVFEEEV